jgi:two-component system cell cycle sensor histidine kinase/response regulator CckA
MRPKGERLQLLQALDEPAALCDRFGRVAQSNAAWRAARGSQAGLIGGEGAFAAFRAAMESGRGEGPLDDRRLTVAAMSEGRFLARLHELPAPPPPIVEPPVPVDNPPPPPDLGELQALQAQLAQRNRLEAVGQLAGGVAHDFNNLLTAIRLRTEDLLTRHPLGDPAYQSLTEIRQTVGRAADLVRQLLTFSRKATLQREVLELDVALMDFEVLLRRILREDVSLETAYGADVPKVRVDRGQLETAVMNLVVNARDAIRAGGGGRIRLETSRVAPLEAVALGYGGPPPGADMALIAVSDDGPGMSGEVLGSVFEPFFTTKPQGEGTGLGLATVYGVVKQADGWIAVESKPGKGATFRIFLPAYDAPVALETPPPPPAPVRRRDLSGQGRILLVEDEDLVRGITARLLRARGYEVLEAIDGEAALDLARDNAGGIDLMISDVIMPGLDGPGLLAAAGPFLEGAPVLFMSGYAEPDFSQLLEAHPEVTFLPKPLDISSLADHVKRRLEERRGA